MDPGSLNGSFTTSPHISIYTSNIVIYLDSSTKFNTNLTKVIEKYRNQSNVKYYFLIPINRDICIFFY